MDNYNSPRQDESQVKVEVTQRKVRRIKPFHESRVTTIQRRKLSNETQAIDSKAIYREQAESSSYKEHKVNALASGADEGRD